MHLAEGLTFRLNEHGSLFVRDRDIADKSVADQPPLVAHARRPAGVARLIGGVLRLGGHCREHHAQQPAPDAYHNEDSKRREERSERSAMAAESPHRDQPPFFW